MRALFLPLLPALLAVAGCRPDEPAGVVCAPTFGRSLQVAVRDSVTGSAIADGASGVITAPGYRDTLTLLAPGDSLWLASSRNDAGRFDVLVVRPGYAAWTAHRVEVVGGVCGVQVPTRLQARLQPLD